MRINLFDLYKKVANVFNETSAKEKENLLIDASFKKFTSVTSIKNYHDALLFTLAYPESKTIQDLAVKEMIRLAKHLNNSDGRVRDQFILSGIANTQTDGAFSLSLIKWMLLEYGKDVTLHSHDKNGVHPKDVFKYIFPEMEFELLADEKLNAAQWMNKANGIKDKHQLLCWIVNQVESIKCNSLLKDQLFESLKIYVTINGSNTRFSRSFGNILPKNTHYHSSGILKKFDELAIIQKKLPKVKSLNKAEKNGIINSARTALALLNREADPITYCHENGLVFYELEHGVSIALFTMLPERRLPLESYVGFMMYKNGYPMAYGGGWLFGNRTLLGINIFEAFRGGESAFVFAQLLRTYKQAFGANYFEVEPYQFGKNNPEGIKSGAFWFYYRFGFRPVNSELYELSNSEAEKIKSNKSYRSTTDTLKKFTAGNVAVNFGKNAKPINPSSISKFISHKIANDYCGDRAVAETTCRKKLFAELKLNLAFQKKNPVGINKLAVFMVLCIDLSSLNNTIKSQLMKLLESKSNSEFEYIKLLKQVNIERILNKECLNFISCL